MKDWFDSGRLRGYRIPGSMERRIPRNQLIKFLKEHGMPLGELEDDNLHRILCIGLASNLIGAIRQLLTEGQGFKIETAASGFEAGIQAESFHPHVIVIDFGLGFSEALMIVENLRKSTNYKTTFILGLANDAEKATHEFVAKGLDEVILKPVDATYLCDMIRRHFDTSR